MVPKAHDQPFISGADTSFTLMYILWIYILLTELFVCRLMNSINWHRWPSAYLLLGFVYFPSLLALYIGILFTSLCTRLEHVTWTSLYTVFCCSQKMLPKSSQPEKSDEQACATPPPSYLHLHIHLCLLVCKYVCNFLCHFSVVISWV